ncbi:MAG: CAP domain-containing protein [Methylobacter sp.]|nr:CAP domain-containing protein [Methylobacter sp.]
MQPEITAAELERQIHQQINRERQNHGLSQLDRDELLAAIARKHSSDMASYHFFSHTNLQGEDPVERAKNLGWNKKKQQDPNTWAIGPGENIFMNHLYDKVVTTKQNDVTVKKEYVWKTQEEIVQSTVRGWTARRIEKTSCRRNTTNKALGSLFRDTKFMSRRICFNFIAGRFRECKKVQVLHFAFLSRSHTLRRESWSQCTVRLLRHSHAARRKIWGWAGLSLCMVFWVMHNEKPDLMFFPQIRALNQKCYMT